MNEIERRHNEGPSSDEERFSHGRDRDNYNIIKGLFVAVLTFYAKCFTRCDGRRIKLDRANVGPEFHDLHDRCMSFRHNFAAHSGAEKLERARIVVAYPNEKRRRTPIKLFRELDQPDLFWTREGETGIRQLVDHVRGFVNDKIEELAEKVQNVEAPRAIADVLGKNG